MLVLVIVSIVVIIIAQPKLVSLREHLTFQQWYENVLHEHQEFKKRNRGHKTALKLSNGARKTRNYEEKSSECRTVNIQD